MSQQQMAENQQANPSPKRNQPPPRFNTRCPEPNRPNYGKALHNFGVRDLREILNKKYEEREQSEFVGPPPDPSYNYLKDPLRTRDGNEEHSGGERAPRRHYQQNKDNRNDYQNHESTEDLGGPRRHYQQHKDYIHGQPRNDYHNHESNEDQGGGDRSGPRRHYQQNKDYVQRQPRHDYQNHESTEDTRKYGQPRNDYQIRSNLSESNEEHGLTRRHYQQNKDFVPRNDYYPRGRGGQNRGRGRGRPDENIPQPPNRGSYRGGNNNRGRGGRNFYRKPKQNQKVDENQQRVEDDNQQKDDKQSPAETENNEEGNWDKECVNYEENPVEADDSGYVESEEVTNEATQTEKEENAEDNGNDEKGPTPPPPQEQEESKSLNEKGNNE